jgi:hypothetical protein
VGHVADWGMYVDEIGEAESSKDRRIEASILINGLQARGCGLITEAKRTRERRLAEGDDLRRKERCKEFGETRERNGTLPAFVGLWPGKPLTRYTPPYGA